MADCVKLQKRSETTTGRQLDLQRAPYRTTFVGMTLATRPAALATCSFKRQSATRSGHIDRLF